MKPFSERSIASSINTVVKHVVTELRASQRGSFITQFWPGSLGGGESTPKLYMKSSSNCFNYSHVDKCSVGKTKLGSCF